jgi:hypothetical protein
MNNKQQQTVKVVARPGVSFLGLLTIAFIVLKLCHVIDWAWPWVLCPLWAGAAIVIGFMLLLLVVFIIGFLLALAAGAIKDR